MIRKAAITLLVLASLTMMVSCGGKKKSAAITPPTVHDYSYSNTGEIAVSHLALDLNVDFDKKVISGTAGFLLDNKTGGRVVTFDTWALAIEGVTLEDDQGNLTDARFVIGDSLPLVGRPLSVVIEPNTRRVTVKYHTTAASDGVQWLSPEQTAGKKLPYVYTQSEEIRARSWVPCQDTPAIRFTYTANVHVPPGMLALMSAENPREKAADGVYRFEMKQPIPSYLLALAVGNLEYRAISPRTGVYSEPEVVDKAKWELADLEKMMQATEKMYGPYRWGQYDVLVLPPSFPLGGMENPRLTFATPVIIAGDRSLVSLIAHEMAHSWSGNLVTNADWNDFWLNEGFTTYIERRIDEAVYGREYANMQTLLGMRDMEEEWDEIGKDSKDTALYVEYNGRNPDEMPTMAAYEKGNLFLTMMEDSLGRTKWDAFLKKYFDDHAFQTMTTKKFLRYLKDNMFAADSTRYNSLKIDEWVYGPGLPSNCPKITSKRFDQVDTQVAAFKNGVPAKLLAARGWTAIEWERFLTGLPVISAAKAQDLDETYNLSHGNAVVQRYWFPVAIDAHYDAANAAIENFLMTVGRRFIVRPVYMELAKTPEGLEFARAVYKKARPGYHAMTQTGIDLVLYPKDEQK
ncbi:MAG TPA: M1 family metallopeptidase [Candidatus Krumholzibacteria bacterium]|nr:M1 family metallopeptidase [Candidatus Krumholzibacteria bacterium]